MGQQMGLVAARPLPFKRSLTLENGYEIRVARKWAWWLRHLYYLGGP